MPESTEYGESTEFPSLIDDVAFLAELEKIEEESLAAPVARPVTARRWPAAPSPTGLSIPRDVNRWVLHPPPSVEPEPIVQRRPSRLPTFLVILLGLCAGAAGSAVVFHERVVQILNLFAG